MCSRLTWHIVRITDADAYVACYKTFPCVLYIILCHLEAKYDRCDALINPNLF